MLKRTTSLFILILFYVLLALLLAEGILRVFSLAAPATGTGYFWNTNHPITGWALAPNAGGRWFNPLYEYDVDVRVNSRGVRSPEAIGYEKPAGVYRILVLGDSYVEALQVPLAESFPQQLGQMLRDAGLQTEVINAGVSGWGTDQQLLWLREEGVRYQPDLVLLAFYPGNDFMNNHMPLELANFGGVRKPFFEWQNNEFVLHNFPHNKETARALSEQLEQPAQAGDAAADAGADVEVSAGAPPADREPPLRTLGLWLHDHLALHRYVEPRVRVAMPRLAVQLARWGVIEPGQETSDADLGPDYVPVTYGVYEHPPAPEWEAAFDLSGVLFAGVRDAAREMNADVAAILVTAPEQVEPERWRRILQQYPAMHAAEWSLAQPTERAEALLADAGIPALDLLPLFVEQAEAGDTQLHLRDDGHWTRAGHALAAAATGNFLISAGLIPSVEGQAIPVSAPRAWTLWELFVWLVLALLLVSLVVSVYQMGLRNWGYSVGVRLGTAAELLQLMVQRRQFVLLPVVVILLLFGGLLIIAQASVVGPFIYTLF